MNFRFQNPSLEVIRRVETENIHHKFFTVQHSNLNPIENYQWTRNDLAKICERIQRKLIEIYGKLVEGVRMLFLILV